MTRKDMGTVRCISLLRLQMSANETQHHQAVWEHTDKISPKHVIWTRFLCVQLLAKYMVSLPVWCFLLKLCFIPLSFVDRIEYTVRDKVQRWVLNWQRGQFIRVKVEMNWWSCAVKPGTLLAFCLCWNRGLQSSALSVSTLL